MGDSPKTLKETRIDEIITMPSDFVNDLNPAAPRLRVNKTAAMTLSTAWQTVNFDGASAYNVNKFPKINNYEKVRWDASTQKFIFNLTTDGNYRYQFYYSLQNNIVGGLLNSQIQCRFVIPKTPVAIAFPFPDEADPYLDLVVPGVLKTFRYLFYTEIYTNADVRTFGLQFQMRQVVASLPMTSVLNCSLLLSA